MIATDEAIDRRLRASIVPLDWHVLADRLEERAELLGYGDPFQRVEAAGFRHEATECRYRAALLTALPPVWAEFRDMAMSAPDRNVAVLSSCCIVHRTKWTVATLSPWGRSYLPPWSLRSLAKPGTVPGLDPRPEMTDAARSQILRAVRRLRPMGADKAAR